MPKKTTQPEGKTKASRAQGGQNAPRQDRKTELLQHAMECLSTRGYAQTTLRDIASESGMSLGRLYYYFESKEELIALVVSHYKEEFIVSMVSAFEGAETLDQMFEQVVEEYVRAIRASARTHRLWYDIRLQALFDPKFREVVEPIQAALRGFFPAMIKRMEEILGNVEIQGIDTEALYLMADALFFRALQDDVTDNRLACRRFKKSIEDLFASTLIPAAQAAAAGSKKRTARSRRPQAS